MWVNCDKAALTILFWAQDQNKENDSIVYHETVEPLIKCSVYLWNLHFKRDVDQLEAFQVAQW